MLVSAGWADQQGILYFAEGRSGGGKVHLLSQGRLQKLIWRRGQWNETGVTSPSAWKPGAIWSYDQEEGYLIRARFTGAFEKEVQLGVGLVERHFRQLARSQWASAYANLSPAWKKQQSLEAFQKGAAALDYRLAAPPGHAIKVIGHNAREVLVLLDARWFFAKDRGFYRYTLISSGSGWFIDRVDPISAEQFGES